MPPLGLDAHAASKVQESTLSVYRKAVLPFTTWLIEEGLTPNSSVQWDDLLVEWKNAKLITKNQFQNTVAAVEFFFKFHDKLAWSRHVLAGWNIAHVPRHTTPMVASLACLFAIHLSCLGHPRLGIGLLLQQCTGMRPSEMLALLGHHVLFPESCNIPTQTQVVIRLGFRTGTKAKREQCCAFDPALRPDLANLLRRLLESTPGDERLFPYNLQQYGRVLKKISKMLQIEHLGLTPHSPRAGFASQASLEGKTFLEIREKGRWLSDSSLRVYLDVVGALSISVDAQLINLKPQIEQAQNRLLEYFSPSHLCATDGAQGINGK